ncbi:MAG: NADH-quinone oxidoreductase subunit NuoG [Alphaproteobacteria bacterium]|nr:NADH-quinone oxidoreductase subunit NuoG [Alphaproteobacteria bacterium]
MPKLTIDGKEVEVPAGATVLQACEAAGVEVPRFCYHERLSIAGNCRMCLVEMEKAPKPIASCAMPAGDGMVIKTDTPTVRKARRGVMEFLLINHPLDCPICDQGGECDLQDQAMAYGFDRGRYEENKRAVKDKNLGPLVKTFMNRCIHCTRCIRFATEVAGVEELGATGRGEHMEVGTYVEKALSSELSGNIVDLCPVGALTSKPYAFVSRPWELAKTESIDVLDAVGAAIRVDARGGEVLRVLPRLNDAVNDEWLADKSRYAYDGLKRQRLDRPYVRRDGRLQPASWPEAFEVVARRLLGTTPERIGVIAGDQVDAEAVLALRDLMRGLGVQSLDCRQDGAKIGGPRVSYLFNTTIAGIDQADVCLIIGSDPRWEAPLLNARLRKRYLARNFTVGLIGPERDLTYRHQHLGNDPSVLLAIADGHHPFADLLKAAKAPMLILGMGALRRPDGAALLGAARRIAEATNMVRDGWNGFNVLNTAAGRVGALDLGFLPGQGGRDTAGILAGAGDGSLDVVWLQDADEIDASRLGNAFVIYQGHHGDRAANRADVILPGAAYTEKDATYVNLEGRVQRTKQAVFPPGEAREDWKILRALSQVMGRPLPFDSLAQLRTALAAANPVFGAVGVVQPAPWASFGTLDPVDLMPFGRAIENYYQTCAISRASVTMAKCTDLHIHGREIDDTMERTGSYG